MKAFDFSNIDLKVVNTRTRTGSSDDKPYVRLSETPGRFSINSLATAMMGVAPGDKVGLYENPDADSIDGWLFLGLAVDENSSSLYSPSGAKEGNIALSFNMSGIYSRMIQLDNKANEMSAAGLCEKGLYMGRASKAHPDRINYSSLRTIRFELVEGPTLSVEKVVKGEEGEEPTTEVIEIKTWALVESKVDDTKKEKYEAGELTDAEAYEETAGVED